MKNSVFGFAAIAIMIMAAGCNGNHNKNYGLPNLNKDVVYTGILPAADADGIRYTLTLDYDDDRGYTDGDYDLVETYLTADTVSKTGTKDNNTFKSEGNFKVVEGTGVNSTSRYIKLTPKRGVNPSDNLYFLIESDTTLVLVGPDFSRSETPGLNYTLKLAK